MRKRNVFGKKVNTSKPLYYLIVVFTLTIIAFVIINLFTNLEIVRLKEEQNKIQTAINNQLIIGQSSSYQEIEQLIQYLPDSYNEATIYNEMELIKNMSGFSDLDHYVISIQDGANSPFDESLDDDLNFVKITLSMTVDDYNDIFDYIDNVASMERLYYIDELNVTLFSDDSASVSMVLYTFYM